MPERWIVISLDGLANLALGPYGSSWNSTPTMDRLAAQGTTWDRVIVPSDDVAETLHQCWTADVGGRSWVQACRQFGRVEMFLNRDVSRLEPADRLAQIATQAGFDACTLVNWQTAEEPADEIEATAFAHLVMALLERLQPNDPSTDGPFADRAPDWSVLWLHSDFLAGYWDAPRWLFPLQEMDQSDEPIDPSDPEHWDQDVEQAAGKVGPGDPPAALQNTVQPPHYRISPGDHPDWVTSWMQTYGCQVRLVDHVIEWILELLGQLDQDIGFAMLGTSGMSLGQNGWIGNRAGPVRSPQIQVPVILHVPGQPPLRWPELLALPETLARIMPGALPPDSLSWARLTDRPPPGSAAAQSQDYFPRVVTHSERAANVVTTPQWFFVRDPDDQTALFLKPDDRDDANDVASRCREVIEQLQRPAEPQTQ